MILDKIAQHSRQPFMDVLAVFLDAQPDPEALRAFAAKEPGKWAAAVQAFSKMAGFSDKQEVTHEHKLHVEITHMSDAELLDQIAELQRTIRDASPPLLEAVPVRVTSTGKEHIKGDS